MREGFFLFRTISLSVISFFLFFFASCQRELDNPGNGGEPNPPGVDDNIMVTAGLRGTVIDENNQPVSGATVTSGANTTTTDRYGSFRFSNISLSKANGYVKVVKQGYFNANKTFVTTSGRNHNVRIKLIPKTNAGSFDAASGGTVSLSGGGKLVMPASSVTDAGGNVYTGMVNVAMTWINPTAPNLPELVPGDLRGITTDGLERGLETYGMLGVEMTTPGGQPLKIASGKTAELTFPIPASLSANAPATIDLWHFDETKNRWMQEGTAAKNGSNYVANVKHFSFWNCDVPFPLIDLCMTVVNASNNQPLNNVLVRIKRPNGSYGYGWTDSLGNLCGKVPKDEPLVLEIINMCNTSVFSQNIGPFSSNTNLGTISVNISQINQLIITGTVVNCANANVTNGVALIYISGVNSYAVPLINGTFSHTILRCAGDTINFSVTGVDYTTLQQGAPTGGSGTSGTVNMGTIQACGSSIEFFELLINGVPYSYVEPSYSIYSFDSTITGPYQFRRRVSATKNINGIIDGATFEFINNGSPGILPLTWFFKYNYNQGGQGIITSNPTVNIPVFGPPVTGFIEGDFNVQVNFGGVVKNVVCTFRVHP